MRNCHELFLFITYCKIIIPDEFGELWSCYIDNYKDKDIEDLIGHIILDGFILKRRLYFYSKLKEL